MRFEVFYKRFEDYKRFRSLKRFKNAKKNGWRGIRTADLWIKNQTPKPHGPGAIAEDGGLYNHYIEKTIGTSPCLESWEMALKGIDLF